jgi:hypothetical protein
MKGLLKRYRYRDITTIDPKLFIIVMKEHIKKTYKEQEWKSIKLGLSLHVEFYKISPDGVKQTIDEWFNGGCMEAVTHIDLIDDIIDIMNEKMCERIAKFTKEGSGWIISKLLDFEIKIAKYKPLRGSSYIELPKQFQNPKFRLINMKNEDQECFKWCIGRSECMGQKNPQRVSERVKEAAEKYNWKGIRFPMSLQQISKFEGQNDIAVSIYYLDDDSSKLELRQLCVSKVMTTKHVMMLLIEEDGVTHYVLMQSLSPFVDQTHHEKTFPCRFCLHSFYRERLLEKHEPNCMIHAPVRMELAEGPIRFKQYDAQIRHPFVIYADFESTLKKIHGCQPDPTKSYHINKQEHIPNSFCVYTKCEVDKHSKLEVYEGPDAAAKFTEYMNEETTRIHLLMGALEPMELTSEECKHHEDATHCYVCEEPFIDTRKCDDQVNAMKYIKVRDHNHMTGAYRGAAHSECNLKIRGPSFVPVFMHNLSNYDAHLFIKEFGKVEGDLKVIPQTDEKYISISQQMKVGIYYNRDTGEFDRNAYRELRFLDSYRFMASSLDKLSANLSADQLVNLAKFYPEKDQFELLKRKGVYPYEWMDDVSKMNHRQLPPMEDFYSSLKGEGISDAEYQHAQKVWSTFKCETFRDYHMIYLQTDTILLSDVFENFRDMCLEAYKLDPAHYYTSPGLSWSALLKHSRVSLDLIQDPDMLLMVERGIRGGVSTISHRHAKANNPYLPETYDESKPNSYIPYLDANNLYGWAMSQYLPTGGFKWITDDVDVTEVSDTSCKGYILEVDLEYPSELHDLHNDYPMAPESMELGGVRKLVPNLQNKTNYVIHYRALKQCLSHGLKLTKIHQVIEFDQRPWMKSYIDLNTSMRKKATNDFEKDNYKLMNNSVFGKTMENIRKHIDVKLVKTKERVQKLVNKPNFSSFKVFSDSLVAVHMKRTKLKFNKPVYVGQAVLDLSKTLMYDFHYNTIKKQYGVDAQLLFTDTDSLCYHIKTDDMYKDMGKLEKLYDTSNYPMDHPIYSNVNKKVLGKMKDETAGKPIEEFVGLRPKLYAYSVAGRDEKRAKGVAKNVVKKNIQLEDYRRVLFEGCIIHRKMIRFGTELHQIYTQEINKVALSGNDDKRVIQEDGISTLAYGHYKLN